MPKPDEKVIPFGLNPEDALREIYNALFIGDGKSSGDGGIVDTLREVRKDVAQLKADRDRRLTWWHGLGLAAAGGGVGQVIAYLTTHFTTKGGH